jgi:lanthanide-dependent methanol dehydrogenase
MTRDVAVGRSLLRSRLPLFAAAAALLAGCDPDKLRELDPGTLGQTEVFVTWDELQQRTGLPEIEPSAWRAEDGQWLMSLRDYSGTRYSGLDQINASNVGRLQLAWRYETGYDRGHEAVPIVVNNTMYVVMPFPNRLVALDLTQPGPHVKWIYDPEPNPAAQGVACCDHVNRGAVYADGRLYYATLDAHAVAVDAETGAEVWKTRIGEIQVGETITMAPLVVRNNVLFGNSGGEFGVRGWIKALDIATGEVRWMAYSTGPDSDVLIGAEFDPFYPDHRGPDLGMHSWPAEQWRIGGGNVWGWITYDPALDLIYYGTGNAAPWNPAQRPGDNKWAATVFARRPDTGQAVWGYQWDPHNLYDWDGVNENLLLNMPVDGGMRRVIVRAERNGYMYVIDRVTGQVLSADQYAYANAHTAINIQSGRPVVDSTKAPSYGYTARDICPAVPGAKGWEPMAYSPRTGLIYLPANNMCIDMEGMEANFIAGTPYMGVSAKMFAGPGGHLGEFMAWDPVEKRPVWRIRERFLTWSGPLATAGDVVFYGTMDRWFKAVDARTGQTLWRFQVDSGIIAPPMTFLGPDGRQYVAVLSGVGGWAGSIVSVPLDGRDSTADRGIVNAMRDLPMYTGRGGSVYVFVLP